MGSTHPGCYKTSIESRGFQCAYSRRLVVQPLRACQTYQDRAADAGEVIDFEGLRLLHSLSTLALREGHGVLRSRTSGRLRGQEDIREGSVVSSGLVQRTVGILT